uniref:Lipoprotein n=1 Tax=Globodera rostochiensis TaxID=31243 RepID=A0A914HKZ5_GLORO
MKFVLIPIIFALFVCGALAGCFSSNNGKPKKASSVPAISPNSNLSDSAGPRSSTSSKNPKRIILNTEFLAQFGMDAMSLFDEMSMNKAESGGIDSLWQKQNRLKLKHLFSATASQTLDAYNKPNPQHAFGTFGRSKSVTDASTSSNSYKSCKTSLNSSYKSSCNSSSINKSKSFNSAASSRRSFSNGGLNNSNGTFGSSRNASTSGYNTFFDPQSSTSYNNSSSKSVKSDGLRRSTSRSRKF